MSDVIADLRRQMQQRLKQIERELGDVEGLLREQAQLSAALATSPFVEAASASAASGLWTSKENLCGSRSPCTGTNRSSQPVRPFSAPLAMPAANATRLTRPPRPNGAAPTARFARAAPRTVVVEVRPRRARAARQRW